MENIIEWKPIPNYGDLMILEKFIDSVKSGYFIDYDGHGKYGMKDKMSSKMVNPSDISEGNIDRSFTHVIWFNR